MKTTLPCAVAWAYAKNWGYRFVEVANLFAWRATDPKELGSPLDAVGQANDAHLIAMSLRAHLVVAAWGTKGGMQERDRAVCRLLRRHGVPLQALRLTKDGHPSHPLYLPASLVPVLWEGLT